MSIDLDARTSIKHRTLIGSRFEFLIKNLCQQNNFNLQWPMMQKEHWEHETCTQSSTQTSSLPRFTTPFLWKWLGIQSIKRKNQSLWQETEPLPSKRFIFISFTSKKAFDWSNLTSEKEEWERKSSQLKSDAYQMEHNANRQDEASGNSNREYLQWKNRIDSCPTASSEHCIQKWYDDYCQIKKHHLTQVAPWAESNPSKWEFLLCSVCALWVHFLIVASLLFSRLDCKCMNEMKRRNATLATFLMYTCQTINPLCGPQSSME